jgi:hypothetical protein
MADLVKGIDLDDIFIVGEDPTDDILTPFEELEPSSDPYRSWGWAEIDDLPWPIEEDLLVQLGGDSSVALMVWKRLMDDQAVSSTYTKVLQNIISRELVVEPSIEEGSEPTPEALEVAAFIKKELKKNKFDALTSTLLEAYIVGICNVQLDWRPDPTTGELKWEGHEYIFPRRIVYSKKGEGRILTKEDPVRGAPLSEFPRRIITFKYYHVPTDHPYGRGLGVELYHPVLFLRRSFESWNVAGDRHATPLGVATVTPDATKTEKRLLMKQLMNLSRQKGVVLPQGWTIQFAQGKVDSQFYAQQVNMYQMIINKLIAGETTTGEQTTSAGSYSRDRVSMDLLTQRSKMLSDLLSETLNNTLIRWMVDLKFGPEVPSPHVYRSFPEQTASIDVQSMTTLVAAGFEIDPEWVAETYNVKIKAAEDPAAGGGGEAPPDIGDDIGEGGEVEEEEAPPEEEEALPDGDATGEAEDFFGELNQGPEEDEEDPEGEGATDGEDQPQMEDFFTEVDPAQATEGNDQAAEEEKGEELTTEELMESPELSGMEVEETPPPVEPEAEPEPEPVTPVEAEDIMQAPPEEVDPDSAEQIMQTPPEEEETENLDSFMEFAELPYSKNLFR